MIDHLEPFGILPRGKTTIVTAALVGLLVIGVLPVSAQQDDADAVRAAPSAAESSPTKKPKTKVRAKHVEAGEPESQASNKRICIIDRNAVDQRADINVASNRRLAELRNAAQNDVETGRRPIGEQFKALSVELTRNPRDVALNQKRQALEDQNKLVEAKAGLYSREIEATRQIVTQQLQAATMPLVQAVAKASACSLVITRDVVIDVGETLDITQSVIEAMNTKLQFKPFAMIDLSNKAR